MNREKIAKICNHTHTRDGYSVDWEDLKEGEKAVFLNDADQILFIIREEIKGIKNPYPDTRAFLISHRAYGEVAKIIIEALGGK